MLLSFSLWDLLAILYLKSSERILHLKNSALKGATAIKIVDVRKFLM